MRVVQFVTLFLALAVVTGCSHRRAPRPVTTTSLCECSTCRCDQERLVREGAVPADHFGSVGFSETSQPVSTSTPHPAPAKTSDIASKYSNEPESSGSPYSSGNPIEMDSEAPQTFAMPAIDQIKTDKTPFLQNNSNNDLQLDLPDPNQIKPLDQVPSETFPNGAFKPFDRDVFRVKSKIDNVMPLDEQPSILIDKVTQGQQPDLSSFSAPQSLQLQMPQLDEPETSDFQIPESFDTDGSLEQSQAEVVERAEPVDETFQENQFKPVAELKLPALDEAAPIAQQFSPAAQPIRQTETVVEGRLYEDPIVLYARQRRGLLTSSPIQQPGAVQPASMQKPAKQSIVQDSKYDPIYGLPLTDDVDFNSLPAIEQPPVVAPVATSEQAKHLHVHIHHDYSAAPAMPVRQIQQADPQAANVQVVYRDDEGRVIMAPPTPTASIRSAEPIGDQRTYYVPPEQILRLKATSPIAKPRSNPSVATIQMRDTIIHGGTHLLATPESQARPVLTNHGLPGINHEKLREAFKTSATDNPLR